MGNVAKYANLYNEELKNRFLATVADKATGKKKATYDLYFKTFRRLAPIEEFFGKDICQFSLNEMMDALKSMRFTSAQSMRTRLTPIGQYITFAINEGFVENNINVIDVIRSNKNSINLLLNEYAKNQKIMTREHLYEICDMMINFQDAVCFILPFESILGKDMEEMCNLTMDNIDSHANIIKLNNRAIQIHEKSMKYIVGALKEDRYFKSNGNYDGGERNNTYLWLVKNRYVLRNGGKGDNEYDDAPVLSNSIRTRLKRTSKFYNRDFITVKDLYKSGMLDYLDSNINISNYIDNSGKVDISYNEIYDILVNRYPNVTTSQINEIRTTYIQIKSNSSEE